MPRESNAARRSRARRITAKLFRAHPDARCALDHRTPYELLCATILSAQCTDERVNRVTPQLFARYPDARALARASTADVERVIKPTGFYKNKAKSLTGFAKAIVERHGAEVPATMEALVELPGVGRKTANVILGNVYDTPGLVVDTHVARVSQRLELTSATDPETIEADLMELVDRKDWTQFSHAMIFHGRRICVARKPKCEICPLRADCPYPKRAARTAAAAAPKGAATAAKRAPARKATR
jgi:endonuclease-3